MRIFEADIYQKLKKSVQNVKMLYETRNIGLNMIEIFDEYITHTSLNNIKYLAYIL